MQPDAKLAPGHLGGIVAALYNRPDDDCVAPWRFRDGREDDLVAHGKLRVRREAFVYCDRALRRLQEEGNGEERYHHALKLADHHPLPVPVGRHPVAVARKQ